ncbi:ferredoxin [Crossiella equi]|uniref:Ferredoxin n=1 Tax=Crossiella equi TaxID=130796 RepID=A0ABS5AMK6_9PSEU|nr:ferredoxin [Crossiella equi]MBP2477810.1 ferredoxin [Crossiella equi]
MRVFADRDRCCGAGMCALTAPSVFDQDEDAGRVVVLAEVPGPDAEGPVREAVQLCPAGAIRVEE